jgi:hypothetical protein
MPQNEKLSQKPLEYYHESWWKVKDEPVWYLAGKDSEPDSTLTVGWYFSDETGDMNGPFETRDTAELMLKKYCEACL